MSARCDQCFDTGTIDRGGAEIQCPYCEPTIKLTGLSHGLGGYGVQYVTCASFTSSTMSFYGSPAEILSDAVRVRQDAERGAKLVGRKGRNGISSSAIAIEKHVRNALKEASK